MLRGGGIRDLRSGRRLQKRTRLDHNAFRLSSEQLSERGTSNCGCLLCLNLLGFCERKLGPRTGSVCSWAQLVLRQCPDHVVQNASPLNTGARGDDGLLRGSDRQKGICRSGRDLQLGHIHFGDSSVSGCFRRLDIRLAQAEVSRLPRHECRP
jgi:hypothetical protein